MPWYDFSPNSFYKQHKIKKLAFRCRNSGEAEACERLAHAFLYSRQIPLDYIAARKILNYFCLDKQSSSSCIMAGDCALDFPIKTDDVLGSAAKYFENACRLGHPGGCRKNGDILMKENLHQAAEEWYMIGYQVGVKRLQDFQNEVHSATENVETLSSQSNDGEYSFERMDLQTEIHLETAACAASLLRIPSEERKNVDITSFYNQPHEKKKSLQRYNQQLKIAKRTSSEDFNRLEGILSQQPHLPKTDFISEACLASERDKHYQQAQEFYEDTSSSDNNHSCNFLGKILVDRYVRTNQKIFLRKAVQILDNGCENHDSLACEELRDLYLHANSNSEKLIPEFGIFNQKQIKYYTYKSCKENPENCYDYAEILHKEGNIAKAIEIMKIACNQGKDKTACQTLAERTKDYDEKEV